MASNQELIKQAFYDLINSTGLPIEWENAGFQPPATGAWLRATFMPGEPEQVTWGFNGIDLLVGLYQIDVFTPLGQGDILARQTADSVMAIFSRGLVVAATGFSIRVIKSYTFTGRAEQGGYYHLPVIVSWRTEI